MALQQFPHGLFTISLDILGAGTEQATGLARVWSEQPLLVEVLDYRAGALAEQVETVGVEHDGQLPLLCGLQRNDKAGA